MSFFLVKAKAKAAKRDPRAKPTARTLNNSKDTLNRLGCRACPLDKANNCTPKMQPKLAKQTDIYILGDNPSEADDGAGAPFSGKTGKLLREVLGTTHRVSFDNCVRDYDHYRETPSWIPLECCRGLVAKSIEQAKPRVIVGLGIQSLQWMLGSSDMVGLRGRIFAVKVGSHSCYFIPTYHPDFIIEKAFDKGRPLQSKLGHCLKFDVQRAFQAVELADPQIDTPQGARAGIQAFNGRGAGQLPILLKLLSEAAKAPVRAIDLETWPLRPYAAGARLLTCAISFGSTNFAFALNHPKAGWSVSDKNAIRKALKAVLAAPTKIVAHNTPFEVEWLVSELGRDSIFHDVWECTMMQSHFLDERRGKRGGNDDQFQPNPYQALDFLVKQYFGLSYKPLFKLDRKNMLNADLDETLLYNGADTKYTLRLYATQTALLKQRGLLGAYRDAVRRQPTVALMQSIGIDLDQGTNKQFQQRLTSEIAQAEGGIRALTEVQQFIADRKEFNPASSHDIVRLLKDYVKVGDLLINEEGKESTDKAVLNKIDHPIAGLLDQFRNRSKLKSTYVDVFELGKGEFIWPDGKLHPSFNTTFAETGRTSSDEPNQQNWPKRNDAWVRRQIVAPPGYVLVAFDYGQLEACTTAMCTKDKALTEALWKDYDIHKAWAIRAAEIYPDFLDGAGIDDAKAIKNLRSLIKNKMVFPAFFGAKNESVNGYLKVATGLDVPDRVTDKLMDEFWSTFNGVHKWQRNLMERYYDSGFVESPTGRRRHYPLTKNQAVNYPIQSVACDLVCRAMVRLSEYAADSDKWYLHPIWNIHDDLGFCIPDNDTILSEAIEIIYKTMLTPDYDFINVPLSVSGSIGTNWLDMDEDLIGKYWSHKDV